MTGRPHKRRALSSLGGGVKVRGERATADVLAAALKRAATEDADTLTHGFHTYPARMHPAVPRALIEALSPAESAVLDPFCGSGTTLVEGRALGRSATGVDLNPLALRVAEVKCRTPSDDELEAFHADLQRVVAASEERVKARAPSRAPLSPDDVRRYDAHVLKELAGLWEEIRDVPNDDNRRALEVVLSAIVVKFSKQRADTAEAAAEKRIGRFVPTRFFQRKGEELARRWQELRGVVPPGTPAVRLMEGDARRLDERLPRGARFSLAVTSPPYGGTYDYYAHHRLRFAWLGIDDRSLRAGEIGARRRLSRGQGKRELWDQEVLAFLSALDKRLDDEGTAVLLMGDGEVGGERVPADEQIERLCPRARLAVAAVASEPRRDWRGGPPRKEHLIALRRAG